MPAQPSLLRRIGLGGAAALVISNMVGTGIFSTTGFLASDLGSPSLVLLSWLVGGFCALLGAICYSELALNFPISGGEYVYLGRAYGRTWGFIAGWVSLVAGFSAPIAAAALAFAGYSSRVFSGRLAPPQVIACCIIALLSACNLFGIRRGVRLQNVLTALKVLLLLAFAAAALLFGQGDWHNFSQPAARSGAASLWQQFAVSLFWIYVSYSGWNAAAYVAEEIEKPERTLPSALAVGAGSVAVLYLLLNVVFIFAMPLESMKGVLAVGALAASRLFGSQIAGAFSLGMTCALLSTLNAMIIAGPRVYYAMARSGDFFSFAARVHPRWRTPVNAILVQAVCAILLALTPFPQLVVYIGFTLNLFAVLSVASLFRFRRQPGWRRLGIVSFAYPLIPSLFIAVGTWMTVEGFIQKPLISLMTVLTLMLGAGFHRLSRFSRAIPPAIEPRP